MQRTAAWPWGVTLRFRKLFPGEMLLEVVTARGHCGSRVV
jgi:hypothetical protein